jgi:hypothetical protein
VPHFGILLVSESLMVSCAILGMALVLEAALDQKAPTIGLGATQGLIFALGLSSKYLYAPLAAMGVSLLRNRWAFGPTIVQSRVFKSIRWALPARKSGARRKADESVSRDAAGKGGKGRILLF